MQYEHPEGGNIKVKQYQMFITGSSNQHIIDDKIRCFGKWKSSSSEFCTKGVVYLIIGQGDFNHTVKFINNKGSVDEASVVMFDLSTESSYSNQFKKLEYKEPPKAVVEPKSPKKKK